MGKLRFIGTMEVGWQIIASRPVSIQQCFNRVTPDDRQSLQFGFAAERGVYKYFFEQCGWGLVVP